MALAACPCSEDLLDELLQSLPRTLDETYRRMLSNIPSASVPYARQMLMLLCCSKRPLTVSELVDAVAVELGQTPQYNPRRRLRDVNAIQEVCPGLTDLGMDGRTKEPTIQIAHFSVQEYLESGRLQEHDDIKAFSIERVDAHAQMCHICLMFLLEPKLAFSAEQYPFIPYAAKYWPDHFSECLTDESVENRVLQLFQGSRCLLVNCVVIWRSVRHDESIVAWIGEMPFWTPRLPLYFASSLGLCSVLRKLLDQDHPNHVLTGSSTTDSAASLLNQPATAMDMYHPSALYEAIGQNHLETVQLLLEHGALPDSESLGLALRDSSPGIAIAKLVIKHVAEDVATGVEALYQASTGNPEIVECLLDMGANPNQTPSWSDSTPLMAAARWGHNDIAKLLLERGASVDSPWEIRAAVLGSAMGRRNDTSHALLAFLSEEAGDVDAQNTAWESLLLETPRVGDLRTIQHLLKEIVTVNPQLETIKTALSAAFYSPSTEEIIETILEYGVEIISQIGSHILDKAVDLGREDIVRLLIEKQTGFSPKVPLDISTLCTAVMRGFQNFTKFILAQGVDINGVDSNGATPLQVAANSGDPEMVQLLLGKGAEINRRDDEGATALWTAAYRGELEVVQLLLENGSEVNGQAWNGNTSLSIATIVGHFEVAQLLLKEGADFVATDDWNKLPLSHVKSKGGLELVARHIHEGLDVNLQDECGQTPLHHASRNGQLTLAKLLLDEGADPAATENMGRTPLFFAARAGHPVVAQMLLARAPSLKDQKDRYGLTPLSAAITKGRTCVLEVLVAARPTDLECRDALGRNSIWWAKRRGYSDIVRILLDEGKRRGVVLEEGDSNVYPTGVKEGSRFCDICDFIVGIVYGCSLCNAGNFDVCKECLESGGWCLDDTHVVLYPRE